MEKRYHFWKDAWNKSVEESHKCFGAKGDTVRLVASIVTFVLSVGVIVFFGILDWGYAEKYFWPIFGSEIVIIFLLWASTYIVAIFRLPCIAGKVGNERQGTIDYYKELEYLSRASKIVLHEVNEKDWVGVEITNDEIKEFNGALYLIDIEPSDTPIRNPIELLNSGWSQRWHIPANHHLVTIEVARWKEKDLLIRARPAQKLLKNTGTYQLKFLIEGNFYPTLVPVQKEFVWTLFVDIQNRIMKLTDTA